MLGLLSVSISMSVAIVLVALLRKTLHHRWSPRVLCVLWLVIAVRMLIPIQFAAPIIHSPLPVEKTQKEVIVIEGTMINETQNQVVIQTKPSETTQQMQPALKIEETQTPSVHTITGEQFFVVVWLLGILVSAVVRITGYFKLKTWLKKNCELLLEVEGVKVFSSEALPEPMAFGTFKPSVYLPYNQEDEKQWVLTHELVHCEHHDGMMQVIMSLVRAIHWFNPLTIIMERLWEMDRELYCDEGVLNKKSEESYVEYMQVLLSAADRALSKRMYFASGLLDGKKQLKQRFEQIRKWNLKGKGKIVMVSLSVLCLLCAGLIGCSTSIERQIEDVSVAFGEKLHANSLVNPVWFDEITARLDELSKNNDSDSGQLGAYDPSEVYLEYIEHIEKDYADFCTEKGLEAVKLHLMYNRFHEEEETIEFVKVTEYENSYESVIDVTSNHYVLRIYLTFMKVEEKPRVSGFKVTVLEYSNSESGTNSIDPMFGLNEQNNAAVSIQSYTHLAEIFWIDTKTVSGASAAFGLANAVEGIILIQDIPEEMIKGYNDGDVVEITYERQTFSTGEEVVLLKQINHSTGLYEHEYYLNDFINFDVTEILIEKKENDINGISKTAVYGQDNINELLNSLNKVPIYRDYVKHDYSDLTTYSIIFNSSDNQELLMHVGDNDCEINGELYGYHHTNMQVRMYTWYITQFLNEYKGVELHITSVDGELAYEVVNNTDKALSIFDASIRLEKRNGTEWDSVPFADGVGFCGNPSSFDENGHYGPIVFENLYDPLESGEYRLSMVVSDDISLRDTKDSPRAYAVFTVDK